MGGAILFKQQWLFAIVLFLLFQMVHLKEEDANCKKNMPCQVCKSLIDTIVYFKDKVNNDELLKFIGINCSNDEFDVCTNIKTKIDVSYFIHKIFITESNYLNFFDSSTLCGL